MSDFIKNVFDLIAEKNLEKEKNIGLTKKVTVDLATKSKQVDSINPSELFMAVRDFAGNHIQQYINSSPDYAWLKMEYTHPCFDHFNFKYKNQVFSILVDIQDKNGKSCMPPEFIKRQLGEAEKNNLIPCIFPVVIDNPDEPALNTMRILGDGINLFNTITKEKIVPENVASDKKVLMSNWELHNFAIMTVRNILKQQNLKVISFQDIPIISPQLWFLDSNGNKCWVVIRYSVSASKEATVSSDEITEITRRCFKFNGYFCGLNFSPAKTSKEKQIYRNGSIDILFNGFKQIHTYI